MEIFKLFIKYICLFEYSFPQSSNLMFCSFIEPKSFNNRLRKNNAEHQAFFHIDASQLIDKPTFCYSRCRTDSIHGCRATLLTSKKNAVFDPRPVKKKKSFKLKYIFIFCPQQRCSFAHKHVKFINLIGSFKQFLKS